MSRLGIFRRLLLAFGAEDFTIGDLLLLGVLPSEIIAATSPDLTLSTQLEISAQEALAASLELIGVLQDMWNDLAEQLEERDIPFHIEEETSERVMNLEDRLNAAILVAREAFAQNGVEIIYDH